MTHPTQSRGAATLTMYASPKSTVHSGHHWHAPSHNAHYLHLHDNNENMLGTRLTHPRCLAPSTFRASPLSLVHPPAHLTTFFHHQDKNEGLPLWLDVRVEETSHYTFSWAEVPGSSWSLPFLAHVVHAGHSGACTLVHGASTPARQVPCISAPASALASALGVGVHRSCSSPCEGR